MPVSDDIPFHEVLPPFARARLKGYKKEKQKASKHEREWTQAATDVVELSEDIERCIGILGVPECRDRRLDFKKKTVAASCSKVR